MANYFTQYLSPPSWLIISEGWDPKQQNVIETQLTLGNGNIGSRGILEEIPRNCFPGTFFSNIYDKAGAQVTEIVNAPNPIDFRVISEGEKLDVTAMDVHKHKRIMDMQKGFLIRKTIYQNSKKKKFNYQSMRFFSMHDPHIAVMKVYITPLDDSAHITVESAVNSSITNKGVVTEGNKKHVDIIEFVKHDNVNYLCFKTLDRNILLAYGTQLKIEQNKKISVVSTRSFDLKLKKNETVIITKFFTFYTSLEIPANRIKTKTIKTIQKITKKGFNQLFNDHCKVWRKKWKKANIEIEGDSKTEKALRFNIYHLLISAGTQDIDTSIKAKALSGEGYRGHIFWDTEIFILPFFIYTHPIIAKNLLLYRYRRLNEARKNAQQKGFKGAMFPWESADTGKDVTPQWYKNVEGKIEKVDTMKYEHHITADVAYGIFHYFTATNDVSFMLKYGLEIILETARFWASRVEQNKRTKKYEIKHVIGPDEFHVEVNNNAFTNLMAKWNLEIARKIYLTLKKESPGPVKTITKQIELKIKELEEWENIARNMFVPFSEKTGIIEEFENYFKLKKLPLPELDNHFLPLLPKKIHTINKTQFVKQADVVMLLYLLSSAFDANLKKKNYLFYEKRTLHQSSLSVSMHSLMGVEVGEKIKAYRYFLNSVYADLNNIYGNTVDGIHAASLGGTWQAVINGFAGVKVEKGILSFQPKLPSRWEKIKFLLQWKGHEISITINKEKISLNFFSKNKKDTLPIKVYGVVQKLPANKRTVFLREMKQKVPLDTKGFY
ncbi:glycoside hydrolase family 65 protein [bacterium]|nr:glycoside hydrolase family 65 protein [bacterium]